MSLLIKYDKSTTIKKTPSTSVYFYFSLFFSLFACLFGILFSYFGKNYYLNRIFKRRNLK